MNKKFFISLSVLSVSISANALAYTDFENYKPTLEIDSSILDSAYEIFFEKTTQGDSQFYTYEKNNLGELEKVYYKYNYDVKSGVVNSPLVDASSGNVTGYFTNFNRNSALTNYGQLDSLTADFVGNSTTNGALLNQNTNAKIEKIKGDFIGNSIVGVNLDGAAINNNKLIGSIESNFIGNYGQGTATGSIQGGAVYNSTSTGIISSINGNFINNHAFSSFASSFIKGGAIFNYYHSEIGNITGDFIGNYVNSTLYISYGGAIYNQQAVIKSIDGNFIGNYAQGLNYRGVGGAIYNDTGIIERITGDFISNYAYGWRATGGAIFNKSGSITIATTVAKKEILFENNKVIVETNPSSVVTKLNSIDFENADAVVNFDTIADSVINIRDPMRSVTDTGNQTTGGVINKTGAGSLALWGDNSDYYGKFNVNEGSLYAMFDEVQDIDNDPLGQRLNFNLNNATVVFENGTAFRPMITDTKAAFLPSSAVLNGSVYLVPYAISSYDVGTYSYNYDYSDFTSWDNPLASVDVSSGTTEIEIKRDLKGYKNLTELADTYRMRTDLSLAEREMFDNIYYTGEISKDVEEKFAVIAGRDNVSYSEVHKSGVRQFGRQIASRTQNKNCPECGVANGFSDEHLWFNVGKNWVDRDSHGNTVGYKYSPTSYAIGYDYDFIPNALNVGLAISYANGDVKGKGVSIYNTAEVDEYLASLYGKYKPVRAYITGSVGGGIITNKTKIQSSTIQSQGKYDTKTFFANAEIGYDFGNACGVIEPFVGAEYLYIYNDAYTEKGTGARHFESMSWNSVDIPVGLRLSRDIFADAYIITPAIEVAYARSVGDNASRGTAYFVGNAGTPWTFKSDATSRDSLRTNFNLKINNYYVPVAFNFGYARDSSSGYSDDQVYLTMRYNF
ncbi:MAG: autotransporter domain-containing protein [Alphaproteobacteria bacterium]